MEKAGGGWREVGFRLALALIGIAAGACSWFIDERLPRYLTDVRAYLFVSVLVGGYFLGLLAMAGPLRLRDAILAAALPAIPAAFLIAWASQRFETVAELFGRPEPALAGLIVLLLPIPYLIAVLRPGVHWRDYAVLYIESWTVVVRLAAGAIFAGIVWLAVFLSDELLRLVDIRLVGDLLDIPWFPATFTGFVIGLALAIVDEMVDFLSPDLIQRLLRLLVPPALLVSALFVAAIPAQGIDTLFGALSPAGTLLGMAAALMLLVSVGVDADDSLAPQSALMRWSVRGLALLLPVISALALAALYRRYVETGLSPARLAACVAGAVLFTYGVLYALSVLSGRRWMERIRAANGWMALVVIVLAALWLTPVLNPERRAAEDQLARFESGRTAVDDLDLWTLRHQWGLAGRAVFERFRDLAADHPEGEALLTRLRLAEQAPNRAAFAARPTDPVILGARAELKAVMPVVPAAAAAEFDRYVLPWYAGSVASFLEGCRDGTASGRPGCVLVVTDLVPASPGNEAILFYKSFGLLRGEVIVPEPVFRRAEASEVFSLPAPDFAETDALIEQLQDGGFSAGPARINAINIGDRQFTVPY